MFCSFSDWLPFLVSCYVLIVFQFILIPGAYEAPFFGSLIIQVVEVLVLQPVCWACCFLMCLVNLCHSHGVWKIICRDTLRCWMKTLCPEDWHFHFPGTLGHPQPGPPESTFKVGGSLKNKANHGVNLARPCFLFIFVLRVGLSGVPASHGGIILLESLPTVNAGIWFPFTQPLGQPLPSPPPPPPPHPVPHTHPWPTGLWK